MRVSPLLISQNNSGEMQSAKWKSATSCFRYFVIKHPNNKKSITQKSNNMIEALMRGRLQHMRLCKASPCCVPWCKRSSLPTIVAVVVAINEMDEHGIRQDPDEFHNINLVVDAESTIEKHIVAKNIYFSSTSTRHDAKKTKEETDNNKDEGTKEDSQHAVARCHRASSPASVLDESIHLTSKSIVEKFHVRGSNLNTCSRLPLKKRPVNLPFVKDARKRTKIN